MDSGRDLHVGLVVGTVRYPDLPDHVGRNGVVGGEPVDVSRKNFEDENDAMDWCRAVMDGLEKPMWSVPFVLLNECTDPMWTHAFVSPVEQDEVPHYWTAMADQREWYVAVLDVMDHCRTDPYPPGVRRPRPIVTDPPDPPF